MTLYRTTILAATLATLFAAEAGATWSAGQGSMRPDPGTRYNSNVFPGRYPPGQRFQMPMGITGSIPTGYRQSLIGQPTWRQLFQGWTTYPQGQPVSKPGTGYGTPGDQPPPSQIGYR